MVLSGPSSIGNLYLFSRRDATNFKDLIGRIVITRLCFWLGSTFFLLEESDCVFVLVELADLSEPSRRTELIKLSAINLSTSISPVNKNI